MPDKKQKPPLKLRADKQDQPVKFHGDPILPNAPQRPVKQKGKG